MFYFSVRAGFHFFSMQLGLDFLSAYATSYVLLFWISIAMALTGLFILLVLIRISVPRFKTESLSKFG